MNLERFKKEWGDYVRNTLIRNFSFMKNTVLENDEIIDENGKTIKVIRVGEFFLDPDDENGDFFVNFRAVWRDGDVYIHIQDPQYDTDHRGIWAENNPYSCSVFETLDEFEMADEILTDLWNSIEAENGFAEETD